MKKLFIALSLLLSTSAYARLGLEIEIGFVEEYVELQPVEVDLLVRSTHTLKPKKHEKVLYEMLGNKKDVKDISRIVNKAEHFETVDAMLRAKRRSSETTPVMLYLGQCIELTNGVIAPRELQKNKVVHYGNDFYLFNRGGMTPIERHNMCERIRGMSHNQALAYLKYNQVKLSKSQNGEFKLEAVPNLQGGGPVLAAGVGFVLRGLIYGGTLALFRKIFNPAKALGGAVGQTTAELATDYGIIQKVGETTGWGKGPGIFSKYLAKYVAKGALRDATVAMQTAPSFGLVSFTESIVSLAQGWALALPTP